MKLFKILAAISFVAATLILVGCGGNADCVQHTDSNKDFICDNCNTVIERPECEDCKDENKDGKCDVCIYNVGLPVDPDNPADPDNPQTGDSNLMWLWITLLFVSGFGMVAMILLNKRKTVK